MRFADKGYCAPVDERRTLQGSYRYDSIEPATPSLFFRLPLSNSQADSGRKSSIQNLSLYLFVQVSYHQVSDTIITLGSKPLCSAADHRTREQRPLVREGCRWLPDKFIANNSGRRGNDFASSPTKIHKSQLYRVGHSS